MDDEPLASRPSTHPHGGGEVGALAQPGRGRKHGNSRFRATSGRKALTALPTASGEDRATGARAHAQPKAVGLCAPAIVRLERALAHSRAPRKGRLRPGVSQVCGPQVRRNSYGTGPSPTRSNVVRPGSRRAVAVRDDSVVPVDTGGRSNSSNCGERLEAQGGTLLASHGPALIEVNRRSSDMMQFSNDHSAPELPAPGPPAPESPCCVHRLWTTVWTNDLLTLANTRNSAQIHRETA